MRYPPRTGPPPRVGDVVYDAAMRPAVVVEDRDRDGNLTVLITVGADAGRAVPMAAALARRVVGSGADIRCRAARDFAWLHGARLPPRSRYEVGVEGATIAAAPLHECFDADLCAPDPRDGKPSTGCGATDRHLAALRREYRAALRRERATTTT